MEEAAQDKQEPIIISEKVAPSSPTMDPSESPPTNLHEVEEKIGYIFKNKRLLEEAFTHPSYHYTKDNQDEIEIRPFSFQRLEYLGDAVLNLLVTKEQFFLYPSFSSGQLTQLRATNVDTEKLARVAIKYGLHCYLRHKKPLLEERINEFKEEILEYPMHSNGLIDVPKSLANLVESIIGAIFIDCDSNIDIVWQVFRPLLEPMIDAETLKAHPKKALYEVCQKLNRKVKFVDSYSKDSKTVNVLVDDQWVGSAICDSKKEIVHNRAALNALQNIQANLTIKDDNST